MSRVFVVHDARRFDKDKGMMVPPFDLAPAARYGSVTYLLREPVLGLRADYAAIAAELRTKLEDFSDDDYLLPVGDTLAIGLAGAFAAAANAGRVRYLLWDRTRREYVAVATDMWYGTEFAAQETETGEPR